MPNFHQTISCHSLVQTIYTLFMFETRWYLTNSSLHVKTTITVESDFLLCIVKASPYPNTCPVMFIFPLPDISNKSYVLVNSLYVYIYRLVYLWLLLIIVEWLSRPIEQFLELEFNIFQCKVCNHLYSNS